MKPYILAHRGVSGDEAENSKEAFKKALEIGADGVELDVHLSADNELVVIHDERVDRVSNGKGFVKDMTLDELKNLTLRGKNKSKILTLRESLDIIKDFKIINLELKNNYFNYDEIENKVIEILQEYQIEDKTIISSFNHYSIKKITDMKMNITTGILYMATIFHPWNYAKKIGVEFINPHFSALNGEIINYLHKNNYKIAVYGANKKEELIKLIKSKVDIIITDYPKKAMKLRRII
ncbi:MAG: glycerophosphodiester phosphodiesterase family protein [Bacillota bacterium]